MNSLKNIGENDWQISRGEVFLKQPIPISGLLRLLESFSLSTNTISDVRNDSD